MLEAIYTGDELGSGGGGGGGSTNPTSGVMPVNIFGVFQDSLISCDTAIGNGTSITVSDLSELIGLDSGSSNITINGATDQIDIDGTNGINLNSGVFINNHLGLALLRFLSSGASHAAIKVSGNKLQIRNGNDSAYNDFEARSIAATTTIQAASSVTASEFIVLLKSRLQSPSDGIFLLSNNAGTNFLLLNFGPATNAFPALRRDGNGIDIVAGDQSAFTNLDAQDVTGRGNVISFGSFVFGGTSPRGSMAAPADSVITLLNSAGSDFKFLRFGGNTASFPMISKVSNGLHIKTADDTAFTNLQALDITATGRVLTAADFAVSSRSVLSSLVDSNFTLYNALKTNFNLLQFGGITSAFPALKRSAAILQARLADDSAFTDLQANNLITEAGVLQSNNTNVQLRVSGTTSIFRGTANGVQIANGATTANASAQLEVVSTSRGFLPPRMTDAQRLAIASPAVGLMVYQTNTNGPSLEGLYINKSTGWTFII